MCFGPLEGYALWLECIEVVKDSLEEREFGGEFEEFGSCLFFAKLCGRFIKQLTAS